MSAKITLVVLSFCLVFTFLIFYIIVKNTNKVKNMKQEEYQDVLAKRKPVVAGTFYPENKSELEEKILNFFNQAKMKPPRPRLSSDKAEKGGVSSDSERKSSFFGREGSFLPASSPPKDWLGISRSEIKNYANDLRILIVPHAGIDYSGQVAAWGFKQIEQKKYSKIFLLGASHRYFFNHAAVYPSGFWETPLGKTEIDSMTVKNLISEPEIIPDPKPHLEEHSLELELIFLQKVLNQFKIIPILVSQTDENLIGLLAQKIAENFDENSLLVISSDLSHYPDYETANLVDKKTIEGILSGDESIFLKTIKEVESSFEIDTAACGQKAIQIGLRAAKVLKINDFQLIKYENSGDVTGEKRRVVGYAAIGGYSEKISKETPLEWQPLEETEQKTALIYVRKVLENYFSNSPEPEIPKPEVFLKQYGAFVTLRRNGQLRGCIGTFEPQKPLWQTLREMAIAAATQDPRFPPITKDELKEIKIEISILSPRKKIDNWKEIKLGQHGVVVQKGFRSGTFLPQVATETGWDLEEFLSQLCTQKAGLPPDCYKDPLVNLYTFEAQILEER